MGIVYAEARENMRVRLLILRTTKNISTPPTSIVFVYGPPPPRAHRLSPALLYAPKEKHAHIPLTNKLPSKLASTSFTETAKTSRKGKRVAFSKEGFCHGRHGHYGLRQRGSGCQSLDSGG